MSFEDGSSVALKKYGCCMNQQLTLIEHYFCIISCPVVFHSNIGKLVRLISLFSTFICIGGGFGGKELRCNVPYTAVTVAANK